MKTVRIALCQINPTVGDLPGNADKILHFISEASRFDPQIIVFPELAVTGYPPEDLLLKPEFINSNVRTLEGIRNKVGKAAVIVGFVDKGDDIHNAAAIIYDRQIVDIYHKMHLPNYGVFDEFRYFRPGRRCPVYQVGDVTFGVTICEDMWYPEGPVTLQAFSGAEVIININASPYHMGKGLFRERLLSTRAYDNSAVIAYLNTVGGQDELVFDGHSLVVDQRGEIIARGKQFEEDILVADLDLDAVFMKRLHDPRRRQQALLADSAAVDRVLIGGSEAPQARPSGRRPKKAPVLPPARSSAGFSVEEEVYRALVLATRDYVLKNGFRKVCIGLSGGVDSSLVSTIAADAIGRDNVTGVFMPSPYTSGESSEDAAALARNLGIRLIEVPISGIFKRYLQVLRPAFGDLIPDTTEENLQARIRGNILMGLSNKFGWLVLTTGNKSEMSVGYATLYGDMAGGFAVIKDVPKTLVYRISRWRNAEAGAALIPERILLKEPTAELKPDQKDSDTLPPYDVLDPILEAYVERDESLDEILRKGFDREMVRKTVRMIDTSEYKRRQAPPGIKITERAFGRDRRFPITNKYREW